MPPTVPSAILCGPSPDDRHRFMTINYHHNADCGLLYHNRHVDLKGNLIKAMMVLNWLNMLEVEEF